MKYESLTTAVHPGEAPTPLGDKAIMVLGWMVFWGFGIAVLWEVLTG